MGTMRNKPARSAESHKTSRNTHKSAKSTESRVSWRHQTPSLPKIVDIVADAFTTPTKKSRLTLTIEDLSHDGRGVAKHDGQVIFVANTLPSEEVTVDVLQTKKNFLEGRLRTIITPAPERVVPPCPHYGQCGGCQFQHLSYQGQISAKQKQFLQGFSRQGLTIAHVSTPLLSAPFHYRRRAKFVMNSAQQLCFRSLGGKEQIMVEQCLLLEPELNQTLQDLQNALTRKQLSGKHVKEVELIAFDGIVVVLTVARHWSETQQEQWQTWLQEHAITQWVVKTPEQTVTSETLTALSEQVNALSLSVSWESFVQANRKINQAMVQQAVDWLSVTQEDRVLDLFCGIGNFSFALAQTGAEVLGLENNGASLRTAKQTAQQLNLGRVQFLSVDLFDEQTQIPKGYNAVLLDPPFDGADLVCRKIKKNKDIQKVIYISCHQGSLMRDLSTLISAGFKIVQGGMIDQFPQTYHIESMVLLER